MERIIAVTVFLLLVAGSIAFAGDLEPVSYELAVDFDPSGGAIEVVGEIVVRRSPNDTNPIELRLHDAFTVQELRVNGRSTRHTFEADNASRLQPTAKTLVVDVPENAESQIVIDIAYGGELRRLPEFGSAAADQAGAALDDIVSTDRIELAYYSTWYPVAADYGPRFDADLTIDLPGGWTAVSIGDPVSRRTSGERTRWKWAGRQVQDLVILASPGFTVERLERGNATIELYSTELPADFIRREAKENGQSLDLFVDLLGPAGAGNGSVRQVFSPRAEGQGGYSRAPLIVISEGRVRAALTENPDLKGTTYHIVTFVQGEQGNVRL